MSEPVTRRDFMRRCAVGALAGAGLATVASGKGAGTELVWQIDPYKCIQCGNCATHCVLEPSAVKCVHSYSMCGRCGLCYGYYDPEHTERDTAAENQLCPTGAITRTFLEEPYYEYDIDEELCIGCGKCVAGCAAFGNGSLYMQVRHDRCVNCNQCAIATACPANAFTRVPAKTPYLLKVTEKSE